MDRNNNNNSGSMNECQGELGADLTPLLGVLVISPAVHVACTTPNLASHLHLLS